MNKLKFIGPSTHDSNGEQLMEGDSWLGWSFEQTREIIGLVLQAINQLA